MEWTAVARVDVAGTAVTRFSGARNSMTRNSVTQILEIGAAVIEAGVGDSAAV